MKTAYRAALIAAVFVFLIPLSARAEIKGWSIELEPFVGYNLFESRQNLKDALIYGGRFGYNFTQYIGIEASLEFINTNVNNKSIVGTEKGRYGTPADKVDLIFYAVDAVYHIMPDGNFNPFVVAGMGASRSSPAISNNDMTTFNVGVGAKYWVTDRVALRADLRDYIITENFHDNFHNLGVTVGVTFAFGGNEKPEPVVEAKPEPEPEEVVVIAVAEPKAVEKIAAIIAAPKVEKKVIVLALEDIHFDFDKSALTEEAKIVLKRNFELLRKNPNARVRVAGYTSARGTAEYNQKLSERRAHAVREYLIEEKVASPDRLSEIGYGESNPARIEVAPQDMYSDSAKANMRVLFEINVK